MRSLFFGLIALSTTVMIFAHDSSFHHSHGPEIRPITNAIVSMSVNQSTNSTLVAQASQIAANQSVFYAYANATLALKSAANASYWANAQQQQQIYLALNLTALMDAQADVLIFQAAQSQATQYALMYDPINNLAQATILLQEATFSQTIRSAALTTAQGLVAASALQLSNQFTVLASQAAALLTNATTIQTAATAAFVAQANLITQTASVIANHTALIANQKFVQVAVDNTSASSCYTAAAVATNASVSKSATKICDLVAIGAQLMASTAQADLTSYNKELIGFRLAENYAYGAYANSALLQININAAAVQAGTIANIASQQQQIAANAAAGDSVIAMNNAVSAVSNSVTAMNLARQKVVESADLCTAARADYIFFVRAKPEQCKSARINADASSAHKCYEATLLLNLAESAKQQVCAQ